FVARNPKFSELSRDLALHIAAMSPEYVDRESVPAEIVERVRGEFSANVPPGKPADIVQKIVDGKVNKWYEEHVLLDQPFVKDDSISISELIGGVVGVLGERIRVRRFVKYALGDSQ
ncbi:MAG: elongation factor Ts, partial [Candidatus Eremiobacteraeota bacterium]|nr:elongation factor Ts [Candidatus Eremiobacteraeota bacterium]